ncbi:MAG: prephenate dehydrogenase, partial [Acidobacteria bacterium]|nr:prephenate dehydrogenase [Acidobacteriota bacterium]MDW7985209.1 prephenate dehydrogenase [Acidobacteriota bacterium]
YREAIRAHLPAEYQGPIDAIFAAIMREARQFEERVLIRGMARPVEGPPVVEFPFRRVVVVGLGLIGGSIVRALRAYTPRSWIAGVDRDETARSQARPYLDEVGADGTAWLADVDLIVLALPVRSIVAWLETYGPRVTRGLVLDVGSVKRVICEAGWRTVRPPAVFVGGHPMAGAETPGFASSRTDLFMDRPFFLCVPPGMEDAQALRDDLEALLLALGARPLYVTPAAHDRLVTFTSHIHQLVASALAAWVYEMALRENLDLRQGAGPGMYSMTRLAGSSYELWRDILAMNPQAVEAFSAWVEWLRRQGPPYDWEALFRWARQVYEALYGHRGEGLSGTRSSGIRESGDEVSH